MDLRCHSCSHFLGDAQQTAELAMIFDPRKVGRIHRTHDREIRRRCRSCGWINVFHPATASIPANVIATPCLAGALIEMK
jgi:hypothetical protein